MPNVTAYSGKMTASFCFQPLKKEELRGANQSSNVLYNRSAPAASIAITVSPKSIHTPHFHSTHLKLSAAYMVGIILINKLIIVIRTGFEYSFHKYIYYRYIIIKAFLRFFIHVNYSIMKSRHREKRGIF